MINGRDSLDIRFEADEKGNPGEEVLYKWGEESSRIYYYFDEKGNVTDIVRFNEKVKKLLPDVDNNQVSKEELALLNCYVPQDTTLFQQSIEFNIAYAKNVEVSHADVVEAAKKAHAHEFIVSLKDGYDTLVGERGIKLSLGQRQRIALARAFLKDSQLLILDEATSALDSKTESLVQESLEELWKNRTVVAVAHRLSTLNNVDRIIVIDNGEIVEQGSKTE